MLYAQSQGVFHAHHREHLPRIRDALTAAQEP
jgi:hypothetical protein